jgi:hypothetical protein
MIETKNVWLILHDTAIWWSPIVAGFIGAFGVHLLGQSREREKWILDSKKQEFKELVSALSQAYIMTLAKTDGTHSLEDRLQFIATKNETVRIFVDRIFIVKDLDLDSLSLRWRTAMGMYDHKKDAKNFKTEYEAIRDQIVKAANRAAPKTAWQLFLFWRD